LEVVIYQTPNVNFIKDKEWTMQCLSKISRSVILGICGLAVVMLTGSKAIAEEDFAAVVTNASDYDNYTRLEYVKINSNGSLGTNTRIDTIYGYGINTGVAVADFDDDDDLDILLAWAAEGKFLFYERTDADGPTFSNAVTVGNFNNTTTNFAGEMAVADYDNDGLMDFAFSDGDSRLQVYLGDGDGTFTMVTPIQFITTTGNNVMYGKGAGDVDGDGVIDIVTADHQGDYLENNKLRLWLGNDDGTFEEPTVIYSCTDTGTTWNPFGQGVVVADYDCDGYDDILFTKQSDSSSDDSALKLMTGNGDGTFNSPVQWGWNLSYVYMYTDRFPYLDSNMDVVHTCNNFWTQWVTRVDSSCTSGYVGQSGKNLNYDNAGIATPRRLSCKHTGLYVK